MQFIQPRRVCLFRLLRLALVAAVPVLCAEEPDKMSEDKSEADGIGADLERRRRLEEQLGDHHQAPEWLGKWRETRDDLLDRVGLDFGSSYAAVGLVALGRGDPDTGFGGDLTVIGTWHLGGDRWNLPLDLRFRVRHRHAFGDVAPSGVASETGTMWGLVDGFSDRGLEIPDFQLIQKFPRRNIELRYGQMVIESQFDRHSLRSSKQSFLNRAFSSNPAVAFPRFGAGMTLHKKYDSGIDLTIGASSVQGTTSGTQVDFDFGSGDFFSAVQLGWDFKIQGDPARLQAMAWHSDPVEDADLPEGQGVSLVFERALPDCNARFFARAAWAEGAATTIDSLFAAGFAVDRRDNDLLGLALGLGRDSSGADDWQGVLEGFYRWQFGPSLHLTPSVQLVFGQGLPGRDLRLVAGLRGQFAF